MEVTEAITPPQHMGLCTHVPQHPLQGHNSHQPETLNQYTPHHPGTLYWYTTTTQGV